MKTWQYVTITGLLLLLLAYIWHVDDENEAFKMRLGKCEADVLQWSKLAQYEAEFHAVPDETAEIDTEPEVQINNREPLNSIAPDIIYTNKIETLDINANELKSLGYNVLEIHSKLLSILIDKNYISKKEVDKLLDDCFYADSSKKIPTYYRDGMIRNYVRKNKGSWILQADTIRIAVK